MQPTHILKLGSLYIPISLSEPVKCMSSGLLTFLGIIPGKWRDHKSWGISGSFSLDCHSPPPPNSGHVHPHRTQIRRDSSFHLNCFVWLGPVRMVFKQQTFSVSSRSQASTNRRQSTQLTFQSRMGHVQEVVGRVWYDFVVQAPSSLLAPVSQLEPLHLCQVLISYIPM